MNISHTKLSQPKRVALVTGATGFLGCHLTVRLVREGWQVNILSREKTILPKVPEFDSVINLIHDGSMEGMLSCVAQARPDVVFHLASLVLSQHTANDIDNLVQSNILFGNQLLEAMRANKVSCIINTTTFWQHYDNQDYNPVCLYAATKQAFEAILEFYVQAYNIKAISLMLFDTYGSNDSRPKLLNLLNKAAKTGEPLDMSPGDQLINLVHVNDVVDAYLIAAQKLLGATVSKYERYTVSSDCLISLKELVALYAEVTNQKVPVNWGARPYRYREIMVPCDKKNSIEGWLPKVSFKVGFREISDGSY